MSTWLNKQRSVILRQINQRFQVGPRSPFQRLMDDNDVAEAFTLMKAFVEAAEGGHLGEGKIREARLNGLRRLIANQETIQHHIYLK